jgi:hypothetical protein
MSTSSPLFTIFLFAMSTVLNYLLEHQWHMLFSMQLRDIFCHFHIPFYSYSCFYQELLTLFLFFGFKEVGSSQIWLGLL